MPASFYWSASVLRCRPLRLKEEFRAFEQAGVRELHFDLSDGTMTPDLGLNIETIRAASEGCGMQCAAHLLLEQPQRHIAALAKAGCHTVLLQAETCVHGHRLLGQIRDVGLSPGVAVWPSTPLTLLEYLLPMADRVLVLGAEPSAKATLAHQLPERVEILHDIIRYREYRTEIQVEASVDAAMATRLIHAGVQSLVYDAPPAPDSDYASMLRTLRDACAQIK